MTAPTRSGYSQPRRILKNTAANSITQAATMLSTFIFLPLLIHAFSFSVYGVYALFVAVYGYTMLTDLGVGAVLTRIVAERTARNESRWITRAIVSASAIYLCLGIFLAIVMFSLGLAASSLFSLDSAEAGLLRTLLWMGAASQLWYWPTITARNALYGLQRYDLTARVALGIVVSNMLATLFVLVTGHGPVVLVAIRIATMVVASLTYIWMLVRILPAESRILSASRDDARIILKSGSSVFALQLASVMSRQQTDEVILGVFLGPTAVTLYEIGAKLNTLVTTFLTLATSSTLPVAAELNALNRHDSLRSFFLQGTRITATLVAPIIVILVAMAGPFVNAWVGPGSEAGADVARLLLLSLMLLPLYQLGDHILISRDKFASWVPGGLSLAVLNVILSVFLVTRIGVVGVALATLIANAILFPWYMRVFGKEMDLGAKEWLRRTAWPSYPLLLIPIAITLAGASTALGTSLAGLAVVGATALACYWLVMLFAGFTKNERATLFAFARAVARRRASVSEETARLGDRAGPSRARLAPPSLNRALDDLLPLMRTRLPRVALLDRPTPPCSHRASSVRVTGELRGSLGDSLRVVRRHNDPRVLGAHVLGLTGSVGADDRHTARHRLVEFEW